MRICNLFAASADRHRAEGTADLILPVPCEAAVTLQSHCSVLHACISRSVSSPYHTAASTMFGRFGQEHRNAASGDTLLINLYLLLFSVAACCVREWESGVHEMYCKGSENRNRRDSCFTFCFFFPSFHFRSVDLESKCLCLFPVRDSSSSANSDTQQLLPVILRA